MIVVTLTILLLMTLISLRFYDNKVLGPWFILCFSHLAVFSIIAINSKMWEVVIYPQFIEVLTTALFCWFLGALCARGFTGHTVADVTFRGVGNSARDRDVYFQLSIIATICIVIYIFTLIPLSVIVGNEDFRHILRGIYESSEGSLGVILSQTFEIPVAIGYVCIYRAIVDFCVRGKKFNILLLIPIACPFIVSLISTDRNILLRYVIFSACCYVTCRVYCAKGKRPLQVVLRALLATIVIASVVFFLFGKAKQYKSSFFDSAAIYAGSGLYNFNLWLHDFSADYTGGTMIISSAQKTLSALGIGSGSITPWNDEFIYRTTANGYVYSSNIYCWLKYYYQDFGWLGVMVIPCVLGFFFEAMYQGGLRSHGGTRWLLYCALVYMIVYQPILEMTFRRLHFGLLYELFWLIFIYAYAEKQTSQGVGLNGNA